MERNGALTGNLACFAAYAMFGFNIVCCKNIALDSLNTPKVLATLLVFTGVALVNFVPKRR